MIRLGQIDDAIHVIRSKLKHVVRQQGEISCLQTECVLMFPHRENRWRTLTPHWGANHYWESVREFVVTFENIGYSFDNCGDLQNYKIWRTSSSSDVYPLDIRRIPSHCYIYFVGQITIYIVTQPLVINQRAQVIHVSLPPG